VEWEEIAVEECQKLIESMPRRVQAVLKAKGGYTKYLSLAPGTGLACMSRGLEISSGTGQKGICLIASLYNLIDGCTHD
jgi:hypothetical protein